MTGIKNHQKSQGKVNWPLMKLVLVSFFLVGHRLCSAQELFGDEILHHHKPIEWNVESPKTEPCVTQRGFWGRNAKFDQRMYYRYELYLKEGDHVAEARSAAANVGRSSESDRQPTGFTGVLSAIETGIADALLESKLFESACSGGVSKGPFRSNGGRQLLRTASRRMSVVGVSTNPEDQILEGLTCQKFVGDDEGPCLVVDGEFVLYLDQYEELDEEIEQFLIKLMNDEQSLDKAHPYIDKVRYIELRTDNIISNEEEGNGGVQPGANTALTSGFYAVITAGAFLIVGTAIFYRRRRAGNDAEATTAPSTLAPQEVQ